MRISSREKAALVVYITFVVAVVVMIIALIAACATVAEGMPGDPAAAECIVPTHGHFLQAKASRGDAQVILNMQYFDRNGDGQPDFVEAYEYVNGHAGLLRPFPSVYLIDRNFDGVYDEAYQDVQGNGRCADIEQRDLSRHKPRAFTQQ